jgi:hypothetical protein
MKEQTLLPTRELPVRQLPACRCGNVQTGKWPMGPDNHWVVIKPQEAEQKESGQKEPQPAEAQLIEYECALCGRRYRLRGTKLYEVTTEGAERAYMRQGQYGRWLSCR